MIQRPPVTRPSIVSPQPLKLASVLNTAMAFLPTNPSPSLSNKLIDVTNDLSLSQIATEGTRQNNILDLFFTTNPTLINRSYTAPPLTSTCDHSIVLVDVNTRPTLPKQKARSRFIYRKAN